MGRSVRAALALLFILPLSAESQGLAPVPAGRFTITPFVGVRIGHDEEFTERVSIAGEEVIARQEVDVEGGPTVGAVLHIPLPSRFSLMGSFEYAFGQEAEVVSVAGDGTVDSFRIRDTGSLSFIKFGAGYQFGDDEPEMRIKRVAGILSAGATLVREDPLDDPEVPAFLTEAIYHWGAAFGAEMLVPLGDTGLHIYLAGEDYLVFWDGDERASRVGRALADEGVDAVVEQDPDASNIVTLRAGLSYRF